ncbi:MAG: OsmC family protein [Acidobacteria bacterium]|nr:OsmC family protein [Acidobacteriota bacterium]
MPKVPPARALTFTTETVWNAGLAGTGMSGEGRSLTVGHEGEWSPEHLLLLAAESCFMSTLLALARAEGIDVLGYVSSGQLQIPDDRQGASRVLLTPCVVVLGDGDAERVRALARQAREESIVARTLGAGLTVALDVRVVPEESKGTGDW